MTQQALPPIATGSAAAVKTREAGIQFGTQPVFPDKLAEANFISSLARSALGIRDIGNMTAGPTEEGLQKVEKYVATQGVTVTLGKTTAEYAERISLSNGEPVMMGMSKMNKADVAKELGNYAQSVLSLYSQSVDGSPIKVQSKDIHDRVENLRRDLGTDQFSYPANKSEYNKLINDIKTFSADLEVDLKERQKAGAKADEIIQAGKTSPSKMIRDASTNGKLVASIREIANLNAGAVFDPMAMDPTLP